MIQTDVFTFSSCSFDLNIQRSDNKVISYQNFPNIQLNLAKTHAAILQMLPKDPLYGYS